MEDFMRTKRYQEQLNDWPSSGRHVLAQFDAETVVVYQAYRPEIAAFALSNQRFGGEFSYSRMSWIKPNFLWMMYRSGWASKPGQERILAISLRRSFFDEVLSEAVPSSFHPARFESKEAWQAAVAASDVRLQWDPDHDPLGKPIQRRAVQLGLRGEYLRRYGQEEIVAISDISDFVIEQRQHLSGDFGDLLLPEEHIYPLNANAKQSLGVE
jgi:hypothetical protein